MWMLSIGYYKNTFVLFEEGCTNAQAIPGKARTLGLQRAASPGLGQLS